MMAVPRRWISDRASSASNVTGSTSGASAGAAISSPSAAASTESAGATMPLPQNIAPPNMPTSITPRACPGRFWTTCSARAVSATMPPSPRLSARVTKTTYLSETTTISAQKNSDRLPRMPASLTGTGWLPAKTSRNA